MAPAKRRRVDRSHGYIRTIREDILDVTGADRIKLYFSEHARWPPRGPARPGGDPRGTLLPEETSNLRACLSTADFLMRIMGDARSDIASYHVFYGGPWAVVRPYDGGWYPTGIFGMLELFAETVGWTTVQTDVNGPATDHMDWGKRATLLVQGLVRGEQRGLLILNRAGRTTRNVTVEQDDGLRVVEQLLFTGPEPAALNTGTDRPLVLRRPPTPGDAGLRRLTVPPHSLVLLRLSQ